MKRLSIEEVAEMFETVAGYGNGYGSGYAYGDGYGAESSEDVVSKKISKLMVMV